jgi:hypothetical protein
MLAVSPDRAEGTGQAHTKKEEAGRLGHLARSRDDSAEQAVVLVLDAGGEEQLIFVPSHSAIAKGQ